MRQHFSYLSCSGWIPNALLTSCSDGVARIWVECLSADNQRINGFLAPLAQDNRRASAQETSAAQPVAVSVE